MIEIKGKHCKDIKVFTDNIEEAALASLHRIADLVPFDGKKIRIMPDVHQGKGNAVIGFSCPIDIEKGSVNPEYVGCDIGCTISAVFYSKPIPSDKIAEFEHRIRKVIPFGFNINDEKKVNPQTIMEAFNSHLHELVSCYPLFSEYIPMFKQEKDLEKWCRKIGVDYDVFLRSIGSVGGGNHFLEYDENNELQKYAVVVHCGSRNLGLKVFGYWNKLAKNTTVSRRKLEEIKAAKEEYKDGKTTGFLSGPNLLNYLVDVCIAQAYAELNHKTIHSQIDEIYLEMSDGGKRCDEIYTTHNYIDYDFKALNGRHNMMLRKGAIRAYSGERCIIPFNMRDGISICEGRSNEEWNYTAPHGCGRLYSRRKAKELLNVDEFKKEMRDANIYTTTADKNTLDEAPSAYKPKDEIVRLIDPTVKILFFMSPKMNIKSSERFDSLRGFFSKYVDKAS